MVNAEDPLENLIRHIERIGRFNGVQFRYNVEPYPRDQDGFSYFLSIEIQETEEWESFLYETDKTIEIVAEFAHKNLPDIVSQFGLTFVD